MIDPNTLRHVVQIPFKGIDQLVKEAIKLIVKKVPEVGRLSSESSAISVHKS